MQIPSVDEIRDLCTSQSFQRGQTYYGEGRIRDIEVEDGTVRATVRGTNDYRVTVNLTGDRIRTVCSCPYDYAGDCKHVVAVLLAVNEGAYGESEPELDAEPAGGRTGKSTDVQDVIERTPPGQLQAFLTNVVEDDRDVRDRFLAFVGADVDTSVPDYKAEIDRTFDEATGQSGIVEWNTHISFSKYEDLAESRRAAGDYETAAEIHRAVAEVVRDNLERVDDSRGYYAQQIADAVEAYARCIADGASDHEERREHVEYLFEQFLEAEYSFVSDDYADALGDLCVTTEDLEYWRELLAPHVADATGVDITDPERSVVDSSGLVSDEEENVVDEVDEGTGEPTADQRLVATDLTTGPLDVDDFTGGSLDVEHLAEGPLEVELFVGDAVDHLPAIESPSDAVRSGDEATDSRAGDGRVSPASVRTRTLVSAALSLLERLDDQEAMLALLDAVCLDSSTFCERYADLLVKDGGEDRAVEVLEAGVDEFQSASDLRRRLVDLYRDPDAERCRHHLTELVVRDRDWAAYDDLRGTCPDEEWPSVRDDIVTRLDQSGGTDLVDLYLHEDEREQAFEAVHEQGGLATLDRYAVQVGDVDPGRYFEAYRDEVAPYLAGETGRRHYRDVIGHLERMQELGLDDRLDAFVADLRDEHSNRPAFLDELEKAGF